MIGSRRRGARDSDDLPTLTVESDLTRVVLRLARSGRVDRTGPAHGHMVIASTGKRLERYGPCNVTGYS